LKTNVKASFLCTQNPPGWAYLPFMIYKLLYGRPDPFRVLAVPLARE
jgi:hypothetical protein